MARKTLWDDFQMNKQCVKTERIVIVCLAGMHRSGTSLMASYLKACGVPMGERLLGAGAGNELGHFEDMEFLEFHKDLLLENSTDLYGSGKDMVVPDRYYERGAELLAKRAAKYDLWGWKEPRTTLFLPFWRGLSRDIRFVFLYRDPYEVTRSLYRRMDLNNLFFGPWKAPLAWIRYNEAVLRFIEQEPAACTLVSISGFIADPEKGRQKLSHWLSVELKVPFQEIYRSRQMNRRSSRWREVLLHAYIKLTQAACAARFDCIHKKLDQLALIPDAPKSKDSSQS